MNDFLNPKSMMTPGACGGLVMFVTNALGMAFDLPTAWTGLTFSFLLGLIVFAAKEMKFLEKSIYYVFNSLIIFATAFGFTVAGSRVAYNSPESEPVSMRGHGVTFENPDDNRFSFLFEPTAAYAQEKGPTISTEELKVLRKKARGPLLVEEEGRKFLSSFMTIKRRGTLDDIRISVDLIHPHYTQLQVELTTPSGQIIMLHDRQAINKKHMVVNFDPEALDSLRKLIGTSIRGDWNLRVYDNANMKEIVFNYWQVSLTFRPQRSTENQFFKLWSFN